MTETRVITTAKASRRAMRSTRQGGARRPRPMRYVAGAAAIAASVLVFILPFLFILFTAAKTPQEATQLDFTPPTEWRLIENFWEVLQTRDFMVVRAFGNSVVLTVASVTIMVILASMVGYVLQRRKSRWNPVIHLLVLAGLIIPPAVVPTIWVMQGLGIFKTLPGLVFIEVAFGLSFCILLFRAFVASIPRELDEAAILDGAGSLRLFFTVIFPLLRSVIITVIVVQSVVVFNDFVNPLYFLPGEDNATVQLTLYNFQAQSGNQWNLLFMNILIVAGMTSGAVKG
jgi:raffinose/stachyose/melibiose transport system permease protein